MNVPKMAAIVGSGLIGSNWAMLFASAGYTVRIFDVRQEQLTRCTEYIKNSFEMLSREGMLRSEDEISTLMSRIQTCGDLASTVKNATYIQECVPEDLDIKKSTFELLDELVDRDDCIIASSSSTIPGSLIFASMSRRRKQAIVAHPVNPVFFCRLVEIVPTPDTRPDVITRCRDIQALLGQEPITLKKEVKGFALNRIQYAILSEAWSLVRDGVLEPKDLEPILTDGLGVRYAFFGLSEIYAINAPTDTLSYFTQYGEGMRQVAASFASPTADPALFHQDSETAKKIDEFTKTLFAAKDKSEVMAYRDRCLTEVAKVKKRLNKEKLYDSLREKKD